MNFEPRISTCALFHSLSLSHTHTHAHIDHNTTHARTHASTHMHACTHTHGIHTTAYSLDGRLHEVNTVTEWWLLAVNCRSCPVILVCSGELSSQGRIVWSCPVVNCPARGELSGHVQWWIVQPGANCLVMSSGELSSQGQIVWSCPVVNFPARGELSGHVQWWIVQPGANCLVMSSGELSSQGRIVWSCPVVKLSRAGTDYRALQVKL